jgi:hypothetical protein
MKIKFVVFLAFLTFFMSSCGGGDIKFDTPQGMNNIENTFGDTTKKDPPREYINNDSLLVITTVETTNIPENISFNYYYVGSKITFYFNKTGMTVSLKERNNWYSDYEFASDWQKETIYPNNMYKNTLNDGTKIVLTTNAVTNKIVKINFGDHEYPIPNVNKNTSAAPIRSTRLKYLENNSIEVKTGQNLKYIVDTYNNENSSAYTVELIKKMNNLTTNTIYSGQIIHFR